MGALSLTAWGAVAGRVRTGKPVVTFAPRRPAPWRYGDLVMIVLFYLLAIAAFQRLLASPAARATTSGELAVGAATSIAANLAATGFALLWIFSHTDATWSDFGWRRDTVRQDVWLGLCAFAAIAAPIYGLQAVLSLFPSDKHPIIEVLMHERSPLLYVLTGLSAVAVAPVAEEFFFRVLLQGWLESASTEAAPPQLEMAQPETQPAAHVPRKIAVLVSSLAFSLAHVGHGYDPIPLFFLGLALGYLYQRTHRLLPCVTVHFCLNASSYLMLCLSPTT